MHRVEHVDELELGKMEPAEVERRQAEARVHLEFCLKLYWIQHRAGRYFLHEHPHSARSWHDETMKQLVDTQGVISVLADQCRSGLKATNEQGEGPAMKPTGFLKKTLFALLRNWKCSALTEASIDGLEQAVTEPVCKFRT